MEFTVDLPVPAFLPGLVGAAAPETADVLVTLEFGADEVEAATGHQEDVPVPGISLEEKVIQRHDAVTGTAYPVGFEATVAVSRIEFRVALGLGVKRVKADREEVIEGFAGVNAESVTKLCVDVAGHRGRVRGNSQFQHGSLLTPGIEGLGSRFYGVGCISIGERGTLGKRCSAQAKQQAGNSCSLEVHESDSSKFISGWMSLRSGLYTVKVLLVYKSGYNLYLWRSI